MISAVPREQAALLANQTERLPGGGEPRYVVGLDVFHQLHCLVRDSSHTSTIKADWFSDWSLRTWCARPCTRNAMSTSCTPHMRSRNLLLNLANPHSTTSIIASTACGSRSCVVRISPQRYINGTKANRFAMGFRPRLTYDWLAGWLTICGYSDELGASECAAYVHRLFQASRLGGGVETEAFYQDDGAYHG